MSVRLCCDCCTRQRCLDNTDNLPSPRFVCARGAEHETPAQLGLPGFLLCSGRHTPFPFGKVIL